MRGNVYLTHGSEVSACVAVGPWQAEHHGRVNCLPGYLIAVRKKGERKGNLGPNITFKYTPQEPDFLVRPHLLKAPPPSKAP